MCRLKHQSQNTTHTQKKSSQLLRQNTKSIIHLY
uniref:Uncharacterized protein n=1 Tax=Anguilla anguilla TaxID=7936 RepID=A0A0E9RMV7_ANGAN